ncbi:hypothetical protein MDAP_000553 [Mitosporidium daphniae]
MEDSGSINCNTSNRDMRLALGQIQKFNEQVVGINQAVLLLGDKLRSVESSIGLLTTLMQASLCNAQQDS